MTALFDDRALQHVVARALAESPDIPEGATGAFVLVGNQDSLKAVVAVKVADDWQVHAVVETAWKDPKRVTYGVSISGTW